MGDALIPIPPARAYASKSLAAAAIVAIICVLGSCGTPPVSLDSTSVRVTKTLSRTLHVDTKLTPKAQELLSAAAEIDRFTSGNVKLQLVFDLDFDSASRLSELQDEPRIVGVDASCPLIRELDITHGRVIGATIMPAARVYLVLDRISPSDFRSVVMHELGHVIGLPDLPERGAVMSGEGVVGIPAPKNFTVADRALFESYRFLN